MKLDFPVIDPQSGQIIIEAHEEFEPTIELAEHIHYIASCPDHESALNAILAELPVKTYYHLFCDHHDFYYEKDELHKAMQVVYNWCHFGFPDNSMARLRLFRVRFRVPWEWDETEECLLSHGDFPS